MTLSDFRRITDELLSAYIDDEVTEQERALVDAAIAADEGIAWRLNSLRQTVTLLHDLPEVVLPRSFTLTFDQVRLPKTDGQIAGVGATEQPPVMLPTAPPRQSSNAMPMPQANAGFWGQMQEGWRRFWQVGNPVLRNAAAVSFALMLLITSGGQMLSRALTQPMSMMTTAPQSAPAAASESAPAEAVALAPTATESTASGSSASELPQEPEANKAPSGESARSVQAQAAPASTEVEAPAAEEAASDTTESPVVASEAVAPSEEDNPADNDVVQEGEQAEEAEAVVAEAAPSSDMSQAAPAAESAAESAAVAAMAAPEIAPLFPEGPRPQMGGGDGLGAGGSMDGLPPQMGGGEAGLVPQQAYGFDASPEGQPPTPYDEESVSASVAAAPAAEAPAESVADVAVTPAVDAPVVAAASASITTATEVTSGITEEEISDEKIPESATTPEESIEATGVEAPVEATVEVTVEPTPEAVALVAPEPITSSEVIENVSVDGAVVATGTAGNLPVVGVAQGTFLLLTIMLTSLWWRSRTPRRPRP